MKVFIDENGRLYKAAVAKSSSDAERIFADQPTIDNLPDDESAITLYELQSRISFTGVV